MASAPLRKEQANPRRAPAGRGRADKLHVAEGRDMRLVLKTDSGVRLLRLDEIECLEAAGNVVIVHSVGGEQHRMRSTLSRLLSDLRDSGFLRVHRSAVVRAGAIIAVEKGRYRKAFAVLRSGLRLEIGRAEFHTLRTLWRPGLLDLQALSAGLYLVSDEP
jgi:DNA-binding LytR/AlgR family response regulator